MRCRGFDQAVGGHQTRREMKGWMGKKGIGLNVKGAGKIGPIVTHLRGPVQRKLQGLQMPKSKIAKGRKRYSLEESSPPLRWSRIAPGFAHEGAVSISMKKGGGGNGFFHNQPGFSQKGSVGVEQGNDV